jgi:glycosyltransferase involved in cell wall biosynthesis
MLDEACLKIVHFDTAHWLFNNHATYSRSLNLQRRRGVTIPANSQRIVEGNLAIEYADCGTILGNQFTMSTYQYAGKPLFRIHIPSCVTFPWPESKDYEACRKNFLWFGSNGLVHKGLDLVLDTFADMPDCNLTICGPIQEEKYFVKEFYQLLYERPNIHTIGWVDVDSPRFIEIADRSVGLIYPSCSEGGGGNVITCMHAGLIPIVSYESSVDVDDSCGLILAENSIDEIKDAIHRVYSLPGLEIKRMSRNAWEFARTHHTKERYIEEFKKTILNIMSLRPAKESRCI